MAVFVCQSCVNLGFTAIPLNTISNIKLGPFDSTELLSLINYQATGSATYFPYVCSEFHRLDVDEKGMVCHVCSERQAWAFDWTLDWSWTEHLASGN